MAERTVFDRWAEALGMYGTVSVLERQVEVRVARGDALTMKCPDCRKWFEFPATSLPVQNGTLIQKEDIVCNRCSAVFRGGRS